MMRAGGLCLVLLTWSAIAHAADSRAYWQDGRAELSAYALKQDRYGQARQGSVVLIYVTEPFSHSARVKADPGKHPPKDVFEVMKLNVVKDFQTGIYDYNLMTSVFAPLDAREGRGSGAPSKIVFSSQEWCGALFEELLFDSLRIRQKRFSYFDGEADQAQDLPYPKAGLSVDALPLLVRGFTEHHLRPKQKKEVQFLPSLEAARLAHRPLAWQKGTLFRSPSPAVTVPAGRFEVDHFVAEFGKQRYEYWVERAFPKRIVAWQGPSQERAELLGSKRMAYWKLNQNGGEKHLRDLGLPLPQSLKSIP